MASISEDSDDNGELSSEWTEMAASPKGDEEAEPSAIVTDASFRFEGFVADVDDFDEATSVENTHMAASIGEQVAKLQATVFCFASFGCFPYTYL